MIGPDPSVILRFIAAMLAAAGILTAGPDREGPGPPEPVPADSVAAAVSDTTAPERGPTDPEGGEEGAPPPLELLHSGTFNIQRSGPEGERRVSVLTDSVLFKQGEQYVLADRAVFVDRQEQVTLTGNVRGWDPVWDFRADEVIYRGRIRLLIATGDVRAEKVEDGTRIRARQVRFDRDTGTGVASGSPYIYQPPADSTSMATEVIGKEDALLSFHEEEGWAELSRGGEIRQGSMHIKGGWMRSEEDPRVLTVIDSVRMVRDGVTARGVRLDWNEETGRARLRGEPPVLTRMAAREAGSSDSVWTRMTADSLDMELPGDELEAIVLHGAGRVEIRTIPGLRPTRPDTAGAAIPERMRLDGREIIITLEDEKIRRLVATRAAMYYWREDAPDRESALGGIDMEVEFEEGEPSVVEAVGNATTRYFQDLESPTTGMGRAQGALIRLTLEDGALKMAYLEKSFAWQYSADMVAAGRVPMAVHPDSVQVGATRRETGAASARKKSRPPPPGAGGVPRTPRDDGHE
ncbi:MAG: hypothetical protein R6W82_07595 [bacterium]